MLSSAIPTLATYLIIHPILEYSKHYITHAINITPTSNILANSKIVPFMFFEIPTVSTETLMG